MKIPRIKMPVPFRTTQVVRFLLLPLAAALLAAFTSSFQPLHGQTNPIFPDALTTGPNVDGVTTFTTVGTGTYTGWSANNGNITVTGAGTTLTGLIAQEILIEASNVTVKDCIVAYSGTFANATGIDMLGTLSGITIENSIICSKTPGVRLALGIEFGGTVTGAVVSGCNIWNMRIGISDIQQGTIENNYIHDFAYDSGDHTDGIFTIGSNTAALYITGNTILDPLDEVDAIFMYSGNGDETDINVTGNLMAGGDWTCYSGGSTDSGVVIENNYFSKCFMTTGGYYGPGAYFDSTNAGNEWSGNLWYEGTTTIATP